jgi:histidinol dehydrogenase
MKRGTKFLARSGIVAAVSAALISTSMAQAAVSSPSGLPGLGIDQTPAQSVPDEPLEERVKQAIEEINQKGQTALAELGELDSPEKIEQAERILKMMEQATREVKQRLHSRVSDRFEELNDLAIARMHYQVQTEL